MEEYIIISRTAIEKRIEKLEMWSNYNEKFGEDDFEGAVASELKSVISHSTPLLPELDKAYEAGKLDKELSQFVDYPKGRYLSNLKIERC